MVESWPHSVTDFRMPPLPAGVAAAAVAATASAADPVGSEGFLFNATFAATRLVHSVVAFTNSQPQRMPVSIFQFMASRMMLTV